MWYRRKYILYSMYSLMYHHFTEGFIFMIMSSSWTCCIHWETFRLQFNVLRCRTVGLKQIFPNENPQIRRCKTTIKDWEILIIFTIVLPGFFLANTVYSGFPKSMTGMHKSAANTQIFCKTLWPSNMNSEQPWATLEFLKSIMFMKVMSTEGAQVGWYCTSVKFQVLIKFSCQFVNCSKCKFWKVSSYLLQ